MEKEDFEKLTEEQKSRIKQEAVEKALSVNLKSLKRPLTSFGIFVYLLLGVTLLVIGLILVIKIGFVRQACVGDGFFNPRTCETKLFWQK